MAGRVINQWVRLKSTAAVLPPQMMTAIRSSARGLYAPDRIAESAAAPPGSATMRKARQSDVQSAFRALASDRRLLIMEWLKRPRAHFRPQVDGDLVKDGVCGVLIAEKLGVSQPTVSEHLRILSQAGLLSAKRVKQWTFYKRDEARIARLKTAMLEKI